jgi:hypothetical protein
MMASLTRRSVFRCLAASVLLLRAAGVQSEEPVRFNRDIRPLLGAHCFKCHGGVKEAGELNLQFRERALKGGESGEIAIVPGKPEASEFYKRLVAEDSTERMPKKEAPLPAEKIALLKRWIAEGAKWEDHWAYEPPRATGKNIDAIVETKLRAAGLAFSPEADLRTLARRLALDLAGLPPEPARVDALEKAAAQDREGALRAFVDELLQSPAYGERWAAPWLDLARYADSRGYEADRFRDMWRYRDWVVDALNADRPYDRFVTEQLAGDLLPGATEEQVIATAFHRNTPQNDEGGTDDEEFRTYAVLDRLNTTFDALQGTSIGCVQCHGHPYDPFVHREYYQLYAFFNNTADADRGDQAPTRKFRARADAERAAGIEKEIAAAQARLDEELKKPELRKGFEAWLGEVSVAQASSPLAEMQVTSTQARYGVEKDGRVKLTLPAPKVTTITVTGRAPSAFAALALEMVPDHSLPSEGPGAAPGGNFILTRIRASLLTAGQETPLEIKGATATFEQGGWPVAEALKSGEGLKGEGESGWAIAGGTGKTQTATFTLAKPVAAPAGAQLRVVLECENERWGQHVLGSFRLATGATVPPEKLAGVPDDVRKLLGKAAAKWKPEEKAKVERHWFSSAHREIADLYRALDERNAALAPFAICDLPIMQELDAKSARKTRIFHRGNWMDKAEEVQPKTPQILNRWHDDYPRNRLGFARWLTNGENPLTARVQVNRVWEQLFGVGLVETLEDFGSQGDKPLYQDLLDELAVHFQTQMKWGQKALLREIVLSRVYRQSSKSTKALTERDPANRLLARGPRFRLGNEQIRDQALAVSGLLSRKMGGPPVKPYQPPGTWLTPYDGSDWKTSPSEDSHRRAIYTLIRRSATYPSMVTFDAPNREFCVVRRLRTNTPLQSLDLLNSPVFMETAAALAKRMTDPGGKLEEQIARGLALATLRPARDNEITVLRELHAKVGGNMTLVANAILNLDEVLTKN